MNKLIAYIFFTTGVASCSSLSNHDYHYQLIPVENTPEAFPMDDKLKPYRDSVEREMSKIIAFADTVFTSERPNGNLNNWVADALLTNQTKNVRITAPVMCLLNTGGLRTSINKGEVTIGDIYRVMPFDNLVVWTRIPVELLPEIAEYITETGGEPISGAHLKNGKLHVEGATDETKEIVIITSDYLVNGGDKMYFFQKSIEIIHTGKLIRNCLITEAKEQGTLISNPAKRIELK